MRAAYQVQAEQISVTYEGGLVQEISVSNVNILDDVTSQFVTSVVAPGYVHLYLVDSDGNLFGGPKVMNYDATKKWHVDGASVASVPNGQYGLFIEVQDAGNYANFTTTSKTLVSVVHAYYFDGNITAIYSPNLDTVSVPLAIPIKTTYTGTDAEDYLHSPAHLEWAKYSITNRWGDVVRQGDLLWDTTLDTPAYILPGVDLSWGGQGTMNLTVSFKFVGDPQTYSLSTTFERAQSTELIIMVVGILGGILVVVLLSVAVWVKRKGHGLDRYEADKKKKKKEKEIKILEISPADIKKAKRGKLPAKKKEEKKEREKGKTQESEDLIFSVPQWEVDELEESETAVEEAAASEPKFSYNLHCSTCNNWYQVEEFSKQKCPTCKKQMNVAVWCLHCQKWFDVPVPGQYSCPTCGQPLKFKK
ncbi:MAG: hypothetical protein Kow0069_10930 [Promethearchaeota archaeon]